MITRTRPSNSSMMINLSSSCSGIITSISCKPFRSRCSRDAFRLGHTTEFAVTRFLRRNWTSKFSPVSSSYHLASPSCALGTSISPARQNVFCGAVPASFSCHFVWLAVLLHGYVSFFSQSIGPPRHPRSKRIQFALDRRMCWQSK
jgi:hypothetical protein